MFLCILSNFCPLNLLLVRSHQAETIIAKRLIQERNNVTRVQLELRSCDQGHRKIGAFGRLPLSLAVDSAVLTGKKFEISQNWKFNQSFFNLNLLEILVRYRI